MSRASKVTITLAIGLSLGTVLYVHYKQWKDKQKLHEGVVRDIERQQKKKIENVYWLQKQEELAKFLKQQEREDDAVTFQLIEEAKKSEC